MIKIREGLFSKNTIKRYKKQQLLKALRISYCIRKKKLICKELFSTKKILNLTNNTGIKFNLPVLVHNINFNWLLKNKN